MKLSLELLSQSSLFNGIETEDVKEMMKCLSAREKKLPQGSFVFRAGDKVSSVYLLTTGRLHIIDEDYWGNRSLIEAFAPNTLFGEAYVFSEQEKHLVSVMAAEDSTYLEMNPKKLFSHCASHCSCHDALIKNALFIISTKIVLLTEKLGHITKRTIREKIMSYLSLCARESQSSSFAIPYSRQQLADYLSVDRSALSHELSRLRGEGLIRYKKNNFELLSAQHKTVS